MSYISSIAADRRQHAAVHRQAQISYVQTLALAQWVWTGRPPVENAGVYRALNETNPNLKGFRFFGLSDAERTSIENGSMPLPVGKTKGGDGHDRHGCWGSYTFHANWRCGMVDFYPVRSK